MQKVSEMSEIVSEKFNNSGSDSYDGLSEFSITLLSDAQELSSYAIRHTIGELRELLLQFAKISADLAYFFKEE